MVACARCGVSMSEASRFCSSCGLDSRVGRQNLPVAVQQTQPYFMPVHHGTAGGFGQMFGLDPRIAFLAFVVDLMLFSGTFSAVATLGLTLPLLIFLSMAAGSVLGFITYKAQMAWYGDDRESALVKGGIVGLLTAIPVGIPALVWLPSGMLGLIQYLKKKAS